MNICLQHHSSRNLEQSLVQTHNRSQNHKQDWYVHLPWVLLSIRVVLQPDIGTSSAKMVLGVDPVVPSRRICNSGIPPSPEEMKGLVKHLEASADYPAKPTSKHNPTTNEYMPTTTDAATHAYIKVDIPKGLMQSYVAPYESVERPSLSTIRVKIGTLKSGVATAYFLS